MMDYKNLSKFECHWSYRNVKDCLSIEKKKEISFFFLICLMFRVKNGLSILFSQKRRLEWV